MAKLLRHRPANLGTQPTARHCLPRSASTGSATVPGWPLTSLLTRTHPEVLLVHACYVTSVVSDPWQCYGLQPARLLCPWDPPGKNTGVDCHFLLQGIFPTQAWNPHLLHWQVDSLPLRHLGSPASAVFNLIKLSVTFLHFSGEKHSLQTKVEYKE